MSFVEGIKTGYKSVVTNETIRGAGAYLKKRSGEVAHEMMESPRQERMEHMRKTPSKRSDRRMSAPRGKGAFRDPYHTGSIDVQGSRGGLGEDMEIDDDMFGVGNYGMEREPMGRQPYRRKNKRARASRHDVKRSLMDPNYVHPSMRGLF